MKNIQNFLKNHIWGLLVHAWVHCSTLLITEPNLNRPFIAHKHRIQQLGPSRIVPAVCSIYTQSKIKTHLRSNGWTWTTPWAAGGLTSSCFENLIRDLRSLTNQLTQTHWPSHVTDSTSQTELELKAAAADWMMNCCPCMKFKHTPRRSSKCSLWLQTHSHHCVDENFLDRHTRKRLLRLLHASLVLLTTLYPDLRPVNLKCTSAGGHMKAPHSLHPTRN